MKRGWPAWLPRNVVTLADVTTFADDIGVDCLELLWRRRTVVDVYRLGRTAGLTPTETSERLAEHRRTSGRRSPLRVSAGRRVGRS